MVRGVMSGPGVSACGEKKGTTTGWGRHWRAGEAACWECREANRVACKEQRDLRRKRGYRRKRRRRVPGGRCVRGLGWPA